MQLLLIALLAPVSLTHADSVDLPEIKETTLYQQDFLSFGFHIESASEDRFVVSIPQETAEGDYQGSLATLFHNSELIARYPPLEMLNNADETIIVLDIGARLISEVTLFIYYENEIYNLVFQPSRI